MNPQNSRDRATTQSPDLNVVTGLGPSRVLPNVTPSRPFCNVHQLGITVWVYASLKASVPKMMVSVTLLACCVGCSRVPATQKTDDLFVWNKPTGVPNNLPISQSTTCRFKHGLSAGFYAQSGGDLPNPSRSIHYSHSNEDEANTVSFIDLDTKSPKVQSNGGEANLAVVSDVGGQLTLLNVGRDGEAVEVYTLFKDTGVVIYSQQKDSMSLGPFGVLEMGYCN